ncbi:hypothetical protein D3C80_1762980 [compost metagenome]
MRSGDTFNIHLRVVQIGNHVVLDGGEDVLVASWHLLLAAQFHIHRGSEHVEKG